MNNLGDKLQVISANPVEDLTADASGSAVDLLGFTGELAFIMDCSAPVAGTSPTLDAKLTHCDTSNGEFEDVSGGAFTQVTDTASRQKLSINTSELKRYLKVAKNIGGTDDPEYLLSVIGVGVKKYSE